MNWTRGKDGVMRQGKGYITLWGWFSLSRASFAVLPRVLMHEMPDDWQARMARCLEEFEDAYPSLELETRVQKVKNGKMVRWPRWLLNYRYPDTAEISKCRRPWSPKAPSSPTTESTATS